MCSRSTASSVWEAAATGAGLLNSDGDTRSVGPGERITARSITFCSSRTLPGHGHRLNASIVSRGTASIGRRSRFAYRWTKCRTSGGMSSGRSRSGGTRIGKTLRR